MYNALSEFFEEKNLLLPKGDGGGKRLLTSLTSVLWYIDGQHDTFEKRCCTVPVIFSSFKGYNVPQLSKHRKRDHTNMKCTELKAFATELFSVLLCPFWKRPVWCTFKPHVEALGKCVIDYSIYLEGKNKSMKIVHASPVPSRKLANSLAISFLSQSVVCPSKLDSLNTAMANSEPFTCINLANYWPSDAHSRYEYVQMVSKGLNVPCTKLSYSGGGNIGNFNFVWRVSGSTEDYMSQSLPIIENVKEKIPICNEESLVFKIWSHFTKG